MIQEELTENFLYHLFSRPNKAKESKDIAIKRCLKTHRSILKNGVSWYQKLFNLQGLKSYQQLLLLQLINSVKLAIMLQI